MERMPKMGAQTTSNIRIVRIRPLHALRRSCPVCFIAIEVPKTNHRMTFCKQKRVNVSLAIAASPRQAAIGLGGSAESGWRAGRKRKHRDSCKHHPPIDFVEGLTGGPGRGRLRHHSQQPAVQWLDLESIACRRRPSAKNQTWEKATRRWHRSTDCQFFRDPNYLQ